MSLFLERSYADVSIADICAVANVSRATFFSYFPAKASLIGEVSRQMGLAWAVEAEKVSAAPVLVKLRRLADFMFDNTLDPNIITPMLNDFRATFGPDTSSGIGEGTMHAHAAALIAQGQRAGVLTQEIPAEDLAHHLIRTTGIQRLLAKGDATLRKERNWRLFATGAAPLDP
jgi:AcrR family transcriptional regulator